MSLLNNPACGLIAAHKGNRRTSRRVYPIFSDEDSDLRDIEWRLSDTGYAVVGRSNGGPCVTYRAHRILVERIIGRSLYSYELIDHINRNKLDNRRENLRIATQQQNQQNTTKRSHNTSGYRGVHFSNKRKKWMAYIVVKGKQIRGGYFSTPEEANVVAMQMRDQHGFFSETKGGNHVFSK